MNSLNKIAAATVLIVIVISLFWESVSAEGAGEIVISDASCNPGESVTLSVNISNNPGLAAIRLKLIYDKSVLRLEKVINGKVFEDGCELFGNNKADVPYYMLWEDALSGTNNRKSGQLVELIFRVLDDTKAEKSIVEIEVDDDSTFDKDLINASISGGKATINIAKKMKNTFAEKKTSTVHKSIEKVSTEAEEKSKVQTVTNNAEITEFSTDKALFSTLKTEDRNSETNAKRYLIFSVPVLMVLVLTVCIVIKRKGADSNEE